MENKKPIYKKMWFWIVVPIALFIMAGVIGLALESDDEKAERAAELERTEQKAEDRKLAREEKKQAKEQEKVDKEKQESEDEEVVATEKKEKEEAYEQAIKDWEDSFHLEMEEHYTEAGITGIRLNVPDDYTVFNAVVPNEFKLSPEEEKTYYVEEVGPLINADLNDHFGRGVSLYFIYSDGNTMASPKMLGGWKIK